MRRERRFVAHISLALALAGVGAITVAFDRTPAVASSAHPQKLAAAVADSTPNRAGQTAK